MDDGGAQSLFVVVCWRRMAPYSSSIIQLETQVHASSVNTSVQAEFSAHIPHLPQVQRPVLWMFSRPPTSSPEDLYMLPDWISKKPRNEIVDPLPGFIFNLNTKKCKIIKPSLAAKYGGLVLTMGDHIYFMAQPYMGNIPVPRFERYDTLSPSWEGREPLSEKTLLDELARLPHVPGIRRNTSIGFVQGTAVLEDTILFNMDRFKMWAYNVGRNKWYPVNVLNNRCYSIVGESAVVNKIIFSLTNHSETFVALSLTNEERGGDLVFTCDVHKEYVVSGIQETLFETWNSHDLTQHLVHLGKDNFCVVRSSSCSGFENQSIQVTYLEVREQKTIVKNICVHEIKNPSDDRFIITLCFSMPKGKITAGKRSFNFNPENEAKIVTHEAEIVTLPPELLQYQVKYSSQRNIIDDKGDHAAPEVQEDVPKKSSALVVGAKVSSKRSTIPTVTGHQSLSYAKPSYATKASTFGDGSSGKSNPDEEEGHSIYVRNLSLEANYRQLLKGLKNFGPIKSVRIHTKSNNMGECCSADVEFERATSKQKAIEASPIKIGGCLAVISEKRGTGLTQVDSNRSSSSGTNKSKNSRSKTTSGGHKDCRNRPKGSRK